MTALSHYGLLMWLSVGKLPSLPLPWWISPWLPNVENGKRSFLLNFPVLKKQTSMIWRGCFAHNFTAIQRTFICTNTRRRDHYIKISHAWLQTEVFFHSGWLPFTLLFVSERDLRMAKGSHHWRFFPQPIHLKHLYIFSDLLKAVFVLSDIFLAKLCCFYMDFSWILANLRHWRATPVHSNPHRTTNVLFFPPNTRSVTWASILSFSDWTPELRRSELDPFECRGCRLNRTPKHLI